MVEHVLADLRRMMQHVDSVLGQVIPVADARKHQQLRGVHRAAAEDHLAPCGDGLSLAALLVLDADTAVTVEDHLRRECLGDEFEVLSRQRRLEVAIGRALSS